VLLFWLFWLRELDRSDRGMGSTVVVSLAVHLAFITKFFIVMSYR
jgi:hypothetical protein